jgi:hypothetical protein
VKRADVPGLVEYTRLREAVLLLAFGLVAIHRAGTNLDYVNGSEFQEIWQQTFDRMAHEDMVTQVVLGLTVSPRDWYIALSMTWMPSRALWSTRPRPRGGARQAAPGLCSIGSGNRDWR